MTRANEIKREEISCKAKVLTLFSFMELMVVCEEHHTHGTVQYHLP